MSCAIGAGRVIPCVEGAAGLLSIYFINRTGTTVTLGPLDDTFVTDIQQNSGAATVYKFELDNTGNNYQENINLARDNGTLFYEQVVTLALQTLQDEDLALFKQLARARLLAVVHYRNGKARLAGISRGLSTSGNNQSGGGFGDFQGFNLTMTAEENDPAPFLEGATVNDPFAGLTTPPTVVTGDES